MPKMFNLYNEVLLQERMAAKALNFHRVALKAGLDPKTTKSIITQGKGKPENVKAVVKALGLTMEQAVKRIVPRASKSA